MPLTVQGMKDFIYPPLKNVTDASQAFKLFCENICEYINKNATITYSWSATNPSGDPDPITMFTTHSAGKGSFNLSNFTTVGPGVNYWCTQMSKVISTQMSILTPDYNDDVKTWVLAPMLFSQTAQFNIRMNGEADFETASTNFCTQFLTQFKTSFINSVSVSGTHLTYTGVATMISVI